MLQRIIVSLMYGLGAAGPVLNAAFADAVISGAEWSGIASAFFLSAWGTFKSNTTIVGPNRTIWTPEDRVVEQAKMDAGVLVADAKVIAETKVEDAKVVADAKVGR